MRHYFAILFCFCTLLSFAQKKTTPDTTKKIVFSEIVKVDSSSRFELYKKASKWVQSQGFEVVEEDPIGNKIIAKNRIIVYTDKSVLAKPNGDFSHDIVLEMKDGRYRYTFSNFTYRYYKQDRNLKYVPVKGSKPMEESSAPGWKKQWGKNKMQVTNKINGYISSLQEALKYVAPKPAEAKKKEDW